MKTTALFSIVLMLSLNGFSQEYPYDKSDTLYQSEGVKFWVGQKIKLGKGSGVNGTFAFINENRTSFAALMTRSANDMGNLIPLPKDMNGLSMEVKKFKRVGNKRMGYKYQLILKGAGTYECDINSALDAKEILL